MSDPASLAFLSGQGIPVDPSRVESELNRLWGPAAERVDGPEIDHPNVTRIVLANLILQADLGAADRLVRTLDEVVTRFPCRAIVLALTGDSGRQVEAEVAAVCHLPAPDRPQVCSERILLRAGPDAHDLLPGAVRPLLETDLPVILWWTGDPRRAEPLFRDLAREATRLILDLPDPGADVEALQLGLDPSICPYARDSAWFGITRWRELIAQFFDGRKGIAALGRIASVAIDAGGPSPSTIPRLPVWLAAWLAGQLGWTPVRRSVAPGRVDAVFQAGDREVELTIRIAVDPSAEDVQLRGATIATTDGETPILLRLERPAGNANDIHVEVCSNRVCALPRVVVAPDLDATHRIAAALESSRHDPPFQRALPHAIWLLAKP